MKSKESARKPLRQRKPPKHGDKNADPDTPTLEQTRHPDWVALVILTACLVWALWVSHAG